jgi:hypothetical protein
VAGRPTCPQQEDTDPPEAQSRSSKILLAPNHQEVNCGSGVWPSASKANSLLPSPEYKIQRNRRAVERRIERTELLRIWLLSIELSILFHKTRLSCFAGADPTQPGAHPGCTYSRLSQTTVASGLSLRPSPALALCPHTNRHLVGCARSGDWPLDGDDSSSSQMQHQKTFGYRIYRRSPQPATRV